MKAGWRILTVLLVFGLCISRPGAGTVRKSRAVALVIGYDDFYSMPDLAPCSANNAEIMTALLSDFAAAEETAVLRRVNGPGTADGLEALILESFCGQTAEDINYLYISTHGVSWEEDGEIRTALMLTDGEQEEALLPARLRAMLDGIPGIKVLILDACHSGGMASEFTGAEYRMLASCAAEEDSYFWHMTEAEESGTGYFTTALESALRASRPEQIDPDGDGWITLREAEARIAAIYGASRIQAFGEKDETPVFRMPEDPGGRERIRALEFDSLRTEEDGTRVLPFRFEVTEKTRVEYRLVMMTDGQWDFSRFATMPDRERTGTVRGLLSPGTKERKIRIPAQNLETNGEALLQIISMRGLHGQVPVLEGTCRITDGAQE